MSIKSNEINKVAFITKYKARDGFYPKFNPVADFELKNENGQVQVVVIEGEGVISVYGLKKE